MRCLPLVVAALLVVGCAPGPDTNGNVSSSSSSVSSSVTSSSSPDFSSPLALDTAFVDPSNRFLIRYPANWSVERSARLATPFGDYEGMAFLVPGETHADTMLLEARMHAAVLDSCPDLEDADAVTLNARTFTTGSWTSVAAGNRYEGSVYLLEARGRCVMLTLSQRYCNLGLACGPDHEEPFQDEALLQDVLWRMAESIVLLDGFSSASSSASSSSSDASSPMACTMEAKLCPDGSYVGRTLPNCEFAPCPGE